MKVKTFFAVIILFLLPFNILAQTNAKNWLENKGKYLLETFAETNLSAKHQKLDKLLLEDIDIDYISNFVIGKHNKSMTTEQKTRYKNAFKNYALSTYKKLPLNFGNDINFDITSITQNKKQINAKVNVNINPDQSVDVEFVLRPHNNTYKITDIKVAQTSLILSYRNRFYEMIAQNDGEIDWFIEDLEAFSKEDNEY